MYKERERESRTGRKKSEYEVGMDGRKYLKEKKECNKRIEEKEKGKEKKKKKKARRRWSDIIHFNRNIVRIPRRHQLVYQTLDQSIEIRNTWCEKESIRRLRISLTPRRAFRRFMLIR